MTQNKNIPQPPKWIDRFLQWRLPEDQFEEVQGDMHELYAGWVKETSQSKANRLYLLNTLTFLRPLPKRANSFKYKRSPYSQTNPFDMLRNYFITTWRTLLNNKSYSAINVTGLTLSLTCCLLLCIIIIHELSYDAYHTNADRIYRVETQKITPEGTDTYPGAPLGVATALRTDFPEIGQVTTINFNNSRLLSIGDKNGKDARFKEPIAFVDTHLFKMFDYQWIAGNPATALSEPNTVVLTHHYARKYFGAATIEHILGQTITIDHAVDLKITGILKDLPSNTNFPLNILISASTQKSLDKNFNPDEWRGWSDNAQTYVLLANNTHPQTIASRFPRMWEKYLGGDIAKTRGSSLLALKELHFNGNYSGRSVEWKTIYMMVIIGVFLILTACVNFINLATAQAIKRSREVGIRKVLGSSRGQLIVQFLSETSTMTLIAMLLAIGLSLLLLPSVASLLDIPVTRQFAFHPVVWLLITASFLLVSFLSGFYPAFVLSSFGPAQAIKNKVSSGHIGGSSLAKTMIVLQFTISLVLIIGTAIVARQMDLFKNADLGFDQESIVTVPIPTQDTDKLRQLQVQLTRLPEIRDVSFSFNSPSAESNFMGELAYQTSEGEVKIRTQFKLADAHFIPTYGIDLLAGKGLPDVDSTSQIVINEVFMQRMGIHDPQAALGKIIQNGDQPLQIVGVARNFHVNSLHQKIDPTIIGINPKFFFQAGIKMASSKASLQKALAHIEQVWTIAFPDQLFSYQFLDQTLDQAYGKETRTFYLLNIFSAIAIFVSCLGLYGLISFMAVQRTKEIGVRKVLGASVFQIVTLLSKDFLKLVLIAFVIASPVGWYVMSKWLEDFEFRIDIGVSVFLMAGMSALLITMVTVGFQAIKAAIVNPVKSLRNE